MDFTRPTGYCIKRPVWPSHRLTSHRQILHSTPKLPLHVFSCERSSELTAVHGGIAPVADGALVYPAATAAAAAIVVLLVAPDDGAAITPEANV